MNVDTGSDDAVLVRAIAAGDEVALKVLFDRHAPWLAARLRRRCNDEEVVADVLSDTFLAVWRGAGRFRSDGEPAAWLWGISVRRLISRLRGRPAPEPLAADAIDARAEPLASAEEEVLEAVEFGDLGAALSGLSPELRAAVQATVLDGLSTREAARLLGIPQGTLKGRLRKAKAEMRGALVGGAAPEGRPA